MRKSIPGRNKQDFFIIVVTLIYQKRERPVGSPPVTGFASFRNTITEVNITNRYKKVKYEINERWNYGVM